MVKWMGWPSKFNSWIPTSAAAAVAAAAVVVVVAVVVVLVVVAAVDIHDASLTAAAGNILLVEG